MVMEATPSPQCVGREFVRQYYTLLNQAPAHLHRFYNNNSSFVHGGLGAPEREIIPAVGQKQIHQKIQQLNFRDCHAKISQVDSQATLGEGVVVQVTGELSNAGQPMRRFTQTFVLAAQAPKTYYVHNDIFRYQDLGFPDEEEGELEGVESGLGDGGEREADEGRGSEPEEDEQQAQQHSTAVTAADQQTHAPLIPTQQQPLQQQQPLYYAPAPQQPVHAMMQPVINGSVHEETPLINQQQPSQTQQQQHQYPKTEPAEAEQFNQEQQEADSSTEQQQQQQQQQTEEESQPQQEESQEQQPESENFSTQGREAETEQTSTASANSNKPKTFANLFSTPFSNPLPPTTSQPPKMSVSPPPMTNLRVTDDRSIAHQTNSGPAMSASSNMSPGQQQMHRTRSNQPPQQQQPRPPRGGPAPRENDRRGSRPGGYSDEHQLFLGNLPHQATDDELRAIFGRYGKVVDLRIHSKSTGGGKGPQGHSHSHSMARVPNYGFITFEDTQTVCKVLQAGSIFYPDENGQKLNIEEKKMRPRLPMEGSGGSRPSLNDGNMRPPGGQQQQQQQQQQQRGPAYSSGYSGGPGGPMRGGQHGARGGRGGFPRGGEGGRGGGGGMRQPGNPNYQNRAR